jgi:hypothetical protein
MFKLTLRRHGLALVGLAAFAASLAGCGHSTATTATSSAVTQAPSTINTEVVTVATLDKVGADVAASGLAQLDKNRFAAFISDHQGRTQSAYLGKTVRDVINLQISYEVALGLAAQARADDKMHKTELAKLVTSTIVLAQERDRSIVLHMDFVNHSTKEIKKLEIGLEFDDKATGKRIGLAELQLTRNIPGGGHIGFDFPMGYYRFSEDAGPMLASKGKAKKLDAEVTEIKYADGTDAGYDD